MLKLLNNVNEITELESVSNFRNVNRDIVFEKTMFLTTWHQYYNIHKFRDEVSKMIELLGKPSFIGKNGSNFSFNIKNYVWMFRNNYEKKQLVAVFLSSEGLSIEMTRECEDETINLLDELIEKILPNIENPW